MIPKKKLQNNVVYSKIKKFVHKKNEKKTAKVWGEKEPQPEKIPKNKKWLINFFTREAITHKPCFYGQSIRQH